MNLKDIVNRDLVTLTNCESEPIHIPGAIQPHGFLIAFTATQQIVRFCSENVVSYTGISHAAMIGKPISDVFGSSAALQLNEYLAGAAFRDGTPLALRLGQEEFNCTIHRTDGQYILEGEPFPDGYLTLPDLYRQTSRFVFMLQQVQSLRDLCNAIAVETRAITGYDRVMIYRFDHQYNGEVFAESRREDLEPFLDLHYPHTDIPPQARALYLKNLLRMIPDIGYTPVPVFTEDDGNDNNLDLSHSILRSVSPIHVAYLRNMGVGATLTISLIRDGRLWGLIACHHYSPKNIPHYTRLSAQLQAHFLTSQIAVREASETFEAGRSIATALEALHASTTTLHAEDIRVLMTRPELLEITGSTGVALMFNGSLHTYGAVPESGWISRLATWLSGTHSSGAYATSSLSAHYNPGGEPEKAAAGIIYQALSADGAHYIIWFRQEHRKEVFWAGDPSKAVVKDESGLSPRKSFEKWKALSSDQSRPWSQAEESAAANFAHLLQKQLSLILLSAEEQRYRLLAEQLQQANTELENINWISTHDLQEPLRKIQVFASRALGSEKAAETDAGIMTAVQRMSDAANRMEDLVMDIHTFSKLNHDKVVRKPVALDSLISDLRNDLAEELEDKHGVIHSTALPVVYGEPFLLRQLFTNLLRNGLKFTRPGYPPVLHIESATRTLDGAQYYCITIRDNGIGFDNVQAENIFGLFKRLHTQKEFRGTGIGLAICRKIMDLHNGTITGEGEEGAGAAFHLLFPLQDG